MTGSGDEETGPPAIDANGEVQTEINEGRSDLDGQVVEPARSSLMLVTFRRLGLIALFARLFENQRPLAAIGIALFLGVMIDWLDSFGIEEASDIASANALSALWSPYYGGLDRVGQDEITVVLIRDEFLEAHGADFWPLPYAGQEALVEAIAAYNPRAVFLDLTYMRPQGGNQVGGETFLAMMGAETPANSFADTLNSVRESGTALFVGPIGPHGGLTGMRDTFDSVTGWAEARSGGQVGLERGNGYAYPMRDQGGRMQAAPALFAFACGASDAPDWCPASPVRWTEDSHVQWGFGLTERMAMRVPDRERLLCHTDTLWDRMRVWTVLFWRNLIQGVYASQQDGASDQAADAVACFYHDTLLATDFLERDVADDVAVPLAPFLEGRIVLIGADIPYLSDFVESPNYGAVPGVMLHAMALDNLIENNGVRHAQMPAAVVGGIDRADLVELLALILGVAGIYRIAAIRAPQGKGVARGATNWGAYCVVILAIMLSALLIGYFSRWPPVNLFLIGAGAIGAAVFIDAVEASARRGQSTSETSS